jgi:hypothetical protein
MNLQGQGYISQPGGLACTEQAKSGYNPPLEAIMPTPSSNANKKPPLRLGGSPWLLALAVLLLVAVVVSLGWLLLNRTGGEVRQIEGDGIRLSVPVEWTEEDTSTNQACQNEGLACVVIMSAPQDYNFSVTWYQQLGETTVQAVDAFEWKKFQEYYPSSILLSREDLEVGGLPAIQRTFLQNDEQNTPVYFRQVYVLNGLRLYLITARSFSADTMNAQSAVVDAVIESIEFSTGE